jgi:hypothetical protein
LDLEAPISLMAKYQRKRPRAKTRTPATAAEATPSVLSDRYLIPEPSSSDAARPIATPIAEVRAVTEMAESLTIAFLISSEVAPQRSAVRIANEMPRCCNFSRSWTSTNARLNG